jgi:ADP-heptose:LPS heptosyltransferase
MNNLKIKFNHALGDTAQACALFSVWQQHGYSIEVEADGNKRMLWKAANIARANEGSKYPFFEYVYPKTFWDPVKNEAAPEDDWKLNKIANAITHPLLPSIGEHRQVWDELIKIRLNYDTIKNFQSSKEAEEFLKGMPRPIICIHSVGSNFSDRKSLPVGVTFRTILKLLKETKGSVISLDFDCREPIVGHPRCKGIKPSWGHIGFDRLCTLYDKSDLVIGVDSGPFHCTNFTNVKSLGVFLKIQPTRCCIPNPNAKYLVSSNLDKYWDSYSESGLWNFDRYKGECPTEDDIVASALGILR